MTNTERRLEEQIEEWKKEIGEIPENTCTSIDGVIKDIEKYVDEVENLRINAWKYESAEELGKDLPDIGWSGLTSDLDGKLREDNERLRELGIFWYEKCKELSTSIAQSEQEILKKLGDKWSLARFMHEKYEQYAFIFGWDTQEKTKVEFDNLPEENKKTMLGVASEILLLLDKEINNNK